MRYKQTFPTLLASAAILGSSMVGCSGARTDRHPALTANQAPALGQRVEKALAGKDYANAQFQAEQLVAAAPDNAGYRALLGRAYLANGRYASARTAFTDAMTLGNRDPRTLVSLALCETGLGNADAARTLLSQHIAELPAADYGLAMAMAGDPQEGVRALLEAVKQPDANAQTRQNLAYALALGGAWGQARLIAGQDLPAREAEQRIGQWSQVALANAPEQRVFAMIGVSPRADDAGLPARLALGAAPDAPVQMAAATTDLVAQARQDAAPVAAAPQPVAQPVYQMEQVQHAALVRADAAPATAQSPALAAAPAAAPATPAPTPNTLAVAMSFEPTHSADVPMIRASSDPMRQAVRASFQRSETGATQALVGRAGMSRVAKITAPSAPTADAQASDWVIQLGAYDTAAIAREKWQRISHGKATLGQFREVHSEFSLNGRAFHRLAIRGFGDHGSAMALCKSLRADGQACFVRLDDTGTTRMARNEARKTGDRVAARKPAATDKPKQVASR